MKYIRSLAVGSLTGALMIAGQAVASDYPTKSIAIMVPFNPGGSSDTAARAMLPFLKAELGVDVIIKNVAGAGGAVGWSQLKRARPDGYNVGLFTTSIATLQATKSANFSYSDFQPIAGVAAAYLTVTARGDSPHADLSGYVAAAKANPGKVTLAMGRGSPAQFAAVMVEESSGADFNLVNVGGGAKKKAAVLGGHADAMIEPLSSVIGQHKGGDLKVLAVLAPDRVSAAPDLPTGKEKGFDITYANLVGFIGPKGMPKEAVDRLSAALRKMTENPEYRKVAKNLTLEIKYEGTQAFGKTMEDISKANIAIGKRIGF